MFVERMLRSRAIDWSQSATMHRSLRPRHFCATSIVISSSSAIPMGCWPALSPKRICPPDQPLWRSRLRDSRIGRHDRAVVLCRPGDRLNEVWSVMKERHLKNIPIVDQDVRPLGVLNARDALEALLKEVEYEEVLLRDYVMCVGYR